MNLRKVSTLEAFRHRDRQSSSSVAYVASESVESCLHKVKEDKGEHIVYTLVPEKFRKTNDNKKGVFMAPTDVISDPCVASLLYVSDIKRKMLYQVKLTNPAMVSEVKCKVTAPTALTFISNCLVVADK